MAGVLVQGGLVSYRSIVDTPFVQLPLEYIVPGQPSHTDLPDLIAAIAPQPIVLEGLVDGRNRAVPADAMAKAYDSTRHVYTSHKAADELVLRERVGDPLRILEILEWRNENPPVSPPK